MTDIKSKYVNLLALQAPQASQALLAAALGEAAQTLRSVPGVAQAIVSGAVSEFAAGRDLGEYTPSHTLVSELASADVLDTAEWKDARAALHRALAAIAGPVRVHIDKSFYEMHPGKRMQGVLAERAPRTLFLIVQRVDADKDAEYNYWFDVDDGSAAKYGGPVVGHLEERVSHPGFIRGTRFKALGTSHPAAEDDPGYLTIYELESPAALQSDSYRGMMAATVATGDAARPTLRLFKMPVRHAFVELAQ